MKFENAQQLTKEHPDTFRAPAQEELNSLKVGDIVKVCNGKERWWNVITRISGEKIIAKVDNTLVTTDLRYDDEITFLKKNIYDIYK